MGVAEVYASDKRGAAICTAMSQAGFGFDVALARTYAETLRAAEADARDRADKAVGRPIKRTKTGGFGLKDLHVAFFRDLGAPVAAAAISVKTGRPSLGVDTMRTFAASPRPELRAAALSVLEWRRARKVRSTYIEAIHLGPDLRVHPGWQNYGAVSGRWSCQGPNLMNLPRLENDPTVIWTSDDPKTRKYVSGGIRGLYLPRPGCVLVAFDAKQLEMRIAAYASGDQAMINACNSKDLHAANAEVIFADAFLRAEGAGRKAYRTLAKSAGFAVCYMAEAETVWARIIATPEGEHVKLSMVQAMLRKLRTGFAGYFEWQHRRWLDAVRTGYTESPILGRRRWLGHDPPPTECANFPIQGGAADVMNLRLPLIVEALARRSPKTRIVAQVHDSGVFETPREDASCVGETCREIFEQPVDIGSSGVMLTASFPIDVEESERWH
jgi:DNA polymerase-1